MQFEALIIIAPDILNYTTFLRLYKLCILYPSDFFQPLKQRCHPISSPNAIYQDGIQNAEIIQTITPIINKKGTVKLIYNAAAKALFNLSNTESVPPRLLCFVKTFVRFLINVLKFSIIMNNYSSYAD